MHRLKLMNKGCWNDKTPCCRSAVSAVRPSPTSKLWRMMSRWRGHAFPFVRITELMSAVSGTDRITPMLLEMLLTTSMVR